MEFLLLHMDSFRLKGLLHRPTNLFPLVLFFSESSLNNRFHALSFLFCLRVFSFFVFLRYPVKRKKKIQNLVSLLSCQHNIAGIPIFLKYFFIDPLPLPPSPSVCLQRKDIGQPMHKNAVKKARHPSLPGKEYRTLY